MDKEASLPRTCKKVAGMVCFRLLHVLDTKLGEETSNILKSDLKIAKQLLELLLFKKSICLYTFRERFNVII